MEETEIIQKKILQYNETFKFCFMTFTLNNISCEPNTAHVGNIKTFLQFGPATTMLIHHNNKHTIPRVKRSGDSAKLQECFYVAGRMNAAKL